jgi:hypothetical protein
MIITLILLLNTILIFKFRALVDLTVKLQSRVDHLESYVFKGLYKSCQKPNG